MLNWFKFRRSAADNTVPPTLELSERRAARRVSTYADIVAVSGNGAYRKRGIMLDLSEHGARVRFENGDSLLEDMTLSAARYGIKRKVEMRWRTRTDVGIRFI